MLNARKTAELPRLEAIPGQGARQQGGLARFLSVLLGRPPLQRLSRGHCHRIVIDLKGIPRRMVGSSIGLQLGHLTGYSTPGYAWRQEGTQAEVWYWNEDIPSAAETPTAVVASSAGSRPCPEMLLRPNLLDGFHLIRCQDGFEALSQINGRVQRSRWFAALPDSAAWQKFVQDAGSDPDTHPLPAVQTCNLGDVPARGWSIQTHRLRLLSPKTWVVLVAVTLLGAAFCALLSYQVKLNQRIDTLRQEHAVLSGESASALKLQQQIESQQQQLAVVADIQPKVLQLKLMAQLADAGLFEEDTKVTLQEWEYRNNRIRLQFAVPAEGFVLGEFLESIEKLGLFTEVRLLPGTPPQTVGLQAVLKGSGAGVNQGGAAQ